MKLLHLWQCYTIISAGLLHTVHTQCTAGSDETGTTSANPIFGMVLNIDDRAECTGHIGRVEYTYYQGVKINNQIRNFVSSVSVWSQSSTVFNLRGIRQYLAKTSSNPAGNRGNTVSVTPPLFIRKGEVIGIYVPAPQGNERDVTFVADGSGSICVNGSSGNSISCSTLNGKILRAKATITTTSDDLMTVTTDRVCPTCTIDNSPTPTTGAVDSSNMTLLILGTISGTALMIALLVLGALVILFTVFITKRRKKNSNNMIENPCCKIDALYQTVQDDSSDNNKRQNKNETRVICSIISEYDEPPTSRTHDSHVEEYEMPVMVSTNSHPTEPRGAGAVSPVANKPTGYEVPGYFTLEEGEHYYRHLKQVMTEKEKEIKYTPPARDEGQLYMQLCHAKQIQSDSLVLDSRLGSGQFGEVYKGRLGDKMVAVKLMKEGSLHEERVKFLQEAAIMRQFNNLNIVKMHGIVFENEKAMIVMELLENGDLQNYLLKLKRKYSIVIGVFILLIPIHSNKASPYQLLNFCRQICLGMTYLSCKGFIHCDLAARNVLLSKENICKIADFGMSCDLENEAYYYSKGGKIPIKWTAPEAVIKRKYSSASDVWSYGCVLYEIWSLGRKPFETYSNIYALEKVKDGYRLPPPPGCPRSIYKHMIQCWHPIPRERPDFHRLMLSMLQLESEENDELPSPEAGQLGGGLEAGEMLYPDLQNAYRGMKVNYN
ncbi:PREDICTED: ephrin type-A receptor 4-like isoform X3 [Amphimedon queenslandica]|uniref:Protein kinase domain-containing protein n=1 Tax=Amphimedon queenslandica TaxID=400682 RepID=A0AAN0JEN0_AMPQE|nr:PREDICTED: ephrin type-A receptor 4-like isoform X3 [Amphimedon queenslandica]|eukprot:XP_019855449.1 PREDICTED: ephrin type-A receptor 4-like isoform X3 [Amphimedon queenslandica]